MPAKDVTYQVFTRYFKAGEFEYSGRIMFEILSAIMTEENPLPHSWEYKLSRLLEFLFDHNFSFDTADDFYDMLATIAFKIKQNPESDWKTILN